MVERAKFWCGSCEKETSCVAISGSNLSGLGHVFPSVNRKYYDSELMRTRSRMCRECEHMFETVELTENTFDQLVELAKLGAATLKAQAELDGGIPDRQAIANQDRRRALVARFYPDTSDEHGNE